MKIGRPSSRCRPTRRLAAIASGSDGTWRRSRSCHRLADVMLNTWLNSTVDPRNDATESSYNFFTSKKVPVAQLATLLFVKTISARAAPLSKFLFWSVPTKKSACLSFWASSIVKKTVRLYVPVDFLSRAPFASCSFFLAALTYRLVHAPRHAPGSTL